MQIKIGTSPTGQTVFSSYREISLHVTSDRVFPNVLYANLSGKKKYPGAFQILLREPSGSWKWGWQQPVGCSHSWHLPGVCWGSRAESGSLDWSHCPRQRQDTRDTRSSPGSAEQGCGTTGTGADGPRGLTWDEWNPELGRLGPVRPIDAQRAPHPCLPAAKFSSPHLGAGNAGQCVLYWEFRHWDSESGSVRAPSNPFLYQANIRQFKFKF